MTAPSVRATSGVTIGERTFGRQTFTGVLPAPVTIPLTPTSGGEYRLKLPPASAAVLTFP